MREEPGKRARGSRWALLRPAAVLIAAVAIGLILIVTDEVSPSKVALISAPSRPYSDEARALLGGLDTGDVIEGGWYVTEVFGPDRGNIFIVLELEGTQIEVRVLRHGTFDSLAPLSNDRFDFHYSVPPDAPALHSSAVQSAVAGISARMVGDAPIPPGM